MIIDNAKLTDEGCNLIIQGISKKALISLQLCGNEIGDTFLDSFNYSILWAQGSLLRQLNLNFCKISTNNINLLFHYLQEGYQISLKYLGIAGLGIEEKNFQTIGTFLEGSQCQQLINLDISHNNFDYETSLAFFKILAQNKYITTLNYSHNSLSNVDKDDENEILNILGEIL